MSRKRRNTLEPIDPREALRMYTQSIENDKSQATIYSHKSRLGHFIRWCDEEHIDNLNDVTGRDLHRYRLWRRNEGDINKVTEKTQMDTLRVFIRYCESIDAVPVDLSEKVISPTLGKGDNERDVMLDADVAERILDWLSKYRYASNEHVALTLMWRCLFRRGAVRAVDASGCDADELLLRVRHQPETDTPLKNKSDGERYVALRESTARLLTDYLDSPDRWDVEDPYGREPLVTTRYGRPHAMTIASWTYGVTRPCVTTGECPHGRDVDECEAAQRRQDASKCPSSVSPHAVRRGAITHWLSNDVPTPAVSSRANVDPAVIDKHYDERSEKQRAQQRRKYLNLFDE
jgi:integrase